MTDTPDPKHVAVRDALAVDVARYLKAGGEIRQIPIGASAMPQDVGMRAQNKSSWRRKHGTD